MKQFGKIMLLAMGFGLLAVVLSSIPSHPAVADAGGPNVTIQAPLPLPISGMVGVNNFPSTQAVSGTVNVGNFPSTQPVSFSNTSTTPLFVDTDGPARAPVSGSCTASFNSSGNAQCTMVTVPSGKRLIIDSVSFLVSVAPGQALGNVQLQVQAKDVNGGVNSIFRFLPPLFKGSAPGADVYTFAGQLPVYAEPGNLFISAFTVDTSGTGRVIGEFAGHLVTP